MSGCIIMLGGCNIPLCGCNIMVDDHCLLGGSSCKHTYMNMHLKHLQPSFPWYLSTRKHLSKSVAHVCTVLLCIFKSPHLHTLPPLDLCLLLTPHNFSLHIHSLQSLTHTHTSIPSPLPSPPHSLSSLLTTHTHPPPSPLTLNHTHPSLPFSPLTHPSLLTTHTSPHSSSLTHTLPPHHSHTPPSSLLTHPLPPHYSHTPSLLTTHTPPPSSPLTHPLPPHHSHRLKTCYEEAVGERVYWTEMCRLYNGYCTKLGKIGTMNTTGFLTLAK